MVWIGGDLNFLAEYDSKRLYSRLNGIYLHAFRMYNFLEPSKYRYSHSNIRLVFVPEGENTSFKGCEINILM